MHPFRESSSIVLSLGQPFAKCLRIFPTDTHDRVRSALFESRLIPGRASLFPAIFPERPQVSRYFVAGAVNKCSEILDPGIPNVEKDLRARDRDEFHSQAVLP